MNFLTYGKLVAAQLTQETSTNHFFRRENENKGFTHISYQPDIPYTQKNIKPLRSYYNLHAASALSQPLAAALKTSTRAQQIT